MTGLNGAPSCACETKNSSLPWGLGAVMIAGMKGSFTPPLFLQLLIVLPIQQQQETKKEASKEGRSVLSDWLRSN